MGNWQTVAAKFQAKVADSGQQLIKVIDQAQQNNPLFKEAFERFTEQCRQNINPNLAVEAVKEMLIQHLLTERIFTNIFNNPEFVQKNVIAREIDQVIQALTSQSFSKAEFIKENQLDKFYTVLERAAATIEDYGDKQTFLNTVYERFFQGFAVKVADTHGIVYTPQPIVEFMVKSVEEILQREFGKSLASRGVHIIDPFVGTGNFIVRMLREIRQLEFSQLKHKYQNELHCNEVMLLPYYIACMNIEHVFYELTGEYQPFEGICLVDTFELIEDRQREMFVPENTKQVQRQKEAPIFVIIGNPPYNVGQQNENDNNKNRKYPKLDKMVAETYAKNSKATNKNALSDVYVKAFKWATWRLEGRNEGIVAFVSNNSFLENIAFDGMRSYLEKEFSKIYVLDLGGNVRKNPKLSGTTHNVFGIQVGVSITMLVKKAKS
jgi:predicted helicase